MSGDVHVQFCERPGVRFPRATHLDGIVAGNPANNWTRFYAGAHLWYAQATLRDSGSYIPPAKLPALAAAVNAACDALDGIEDGVLDDPRQCRFDPAGAHLSLR